MAARGGRRARRTTVRSSGSPIAPYWAVLWRSGMALARELDAMPLRGLRVVELGCGLAVPSIVAARAGATVLATDSSREALALVERNAEANDVQIETAAIDWAHADELVTRGPFDLVLAADVLYERGSVALLLSLLPRLAPEAWLADPGRPAAAAFLDEAPPPLVGRHARPRRGARSTGSSSAERLQPAARAAARCRARPPGRVGSPAARCPASTPRTRPTARGPASRTAGPRAGRRAAASRPRPRAGAWGRGPGWRRAGRRWRRAGSRRRARVPRESAPMNARILSPSRSSASSFATSTSSS